MTTPRDAIAGLIDYLRKAAMALYLAVDQTVANDLSPKIEDAATQLDSLLKERDALQARVKELEGFCDKAIASRLAWRRQAEEAESRATRLQQERDEAYERVIQAVRDAPSPDADGHYTMTKEDVIAIIRRLSAGPEKEKKE
jgi:chromosome segregation ATPase